MNNSQVFEGVLASEDYKKLLQWQHELADLAGSALWVMSEPSGLVLRPVGKGRQIDREAVRKLWKVRILNLQELFPDSLSFDSKRLVLSLDFSICPAKMHSTHAKIFVSKKLVY